MRCRFGQNAVTWDEAKQFCGSQGGKLVEIETTEENSAIGAEILRQGISSKQLLFWTGLVGLDRRRPKNWVFDSTKEKPAWTEFHPGQGETEEENCAFLWAFSAPEVPFGSWHDINCGSKGFFFANRIHLSITALCGEYWYLDFLATLDPTMIVFITVAFRKAKLSIFSSHNTLDRGQLYRWPSGQRRNSCRLFVGDLFNPDHLHGNHCPDDLPP